MYKRKLDVQTQQYIAMDFSLSISDVMSALLFVFILILIMFSVNMSVSESDYRSESIQVSEERERLKQINTANEEKLKNLETGMLELRDLASNLKQDVDMQLAKTAQLLSQLLTDIQQDLQVKENLRVFIDPHHGILRFPGEILFPLGSDQFVPGGEEILKKLAQVMRYHLPCYSGSVDDDMRRPSFCADRKWNPGTLDAIYIEGHTDNVPLTNSKRYTNNLHLSSMRAIKTFEILVMASGKESNFSELHNQKGQPIFGISGYGEYRPIIAHSSPTPEAANRRIDIRFFMVNPKPPSAIPQVFEGLDRLIQKLGTLNNENTIEPQPKP
ncbi:putative Flagellar motor protein MotB [Gammaproteobacteria bacterium]